MERVLNLAGRFGRNVASRFALDLGVRFGRNAASRFARDLGGLLYPSCCLVCGKRMNSDAGLCAYCLHSAFEPFDTGHKWAERALVLPGWMRAQYALWHFDKGGFLQDVLHQLKYGGRPALGELLGSELGRRMVASGMVARKPHELREPHAQGSAILTDHPDLVVKSMADSIVSSGLSIPSERVEAGPLYTGAETASDTRECCTLLLPVPLHPRRERKRGYNQAACIARGVAQVTGFGLVPNGWVSRPKATATQTTLGAMVRKKNMQDVFQMHQPERFKGRHVIVVDDVITTGATALTLAELLRESCDGVSVATIAVA